MKITAFFGSPRENGNTDLLLKETIKGIEDSGFEVRLFNLNAMDAEGRGGARRKRRCDELRRASGYCGTGRKGISLFPR